MVKGTALHEQFKIALNEVRKDKAMLLKTEGDITNAVTNKLREAILESRANMKSGKFDNCCKGIMLQEYYYGGCIPGEEAETIKTQIQVCVENFFKTKTFDRLSSLSELEIIENDESGFNNCLYCNDVKLYFRY
jgi:hypothetical protein